MSLDNLRSAWQSACGLRSLSATVVEGATHVAFVADGRRCISISRELLWEPEAPGALWKAAIAFADDTDRSTDRWPVASNATR